MVLVITGYPSDHFLIPDLYLLAEQDAEEVCEQEPFETPCAKPLAF